MLGFEYYFGQIFSIERWSIERKIQVSAAKFKVKTRGPKWP
jgi:hypothetical protein